MAHSNQQTINEQRLDTWLWASRFFKSRKIAHQAVSAGHVWINGNKSKPARGVKPGDKLLIRRGHDKFEVEVLALCIKRVGAPIAQTLYKETDKSREKRKAQSELRKLNATGIPHTPKRPSKRERRQLLKLKDKQ